ncbi:MAG: porin family protein [Chitinophagaceae bacterium]
MKYYLLLLLITSSLNILAQTGAPGADKRKLGLKTGVNFSTVHLKNDGGPKLSSRQGIMVAGFYSPATRGIMGFRSEVVYSRQGFTSADGDVKTIVSNDYLLLPQFTTINISRFFQLQLGGQVGYLINAKGKQESSSFDLKQLTNRIDYGAAGGVEIYPFKGLIIGGRYNMSFGDVYKSTSTPGSGDPVSGMFDIKSRNGVISIFLGYQF